MTSIRSLCVYCGSNIGSAGHQRAARRLGTMLAQRGITLVYGGGMVGLMGICADAVLEAGGKVIGVIPKHLDDLEVGHRGVTDLIVCRNMHERKERMFDLSDAFAVLPGGYGTLDEAFEMITWRQLRLHDKPLVFVDIDGYWQPLRKLLDHIIDESYARPDTRRFYSVVERVEDVFQALARAPEPVVEPKSELI